MSENIKEKEWRSILSDWKQSGLIRSEYCRKHSLKLSTFDYWNGKIKKEGAKKSETPAIGPLVKVKSYLSDGASSLIIDFPGGYRLNIPSNAEPSILMPILQAIKEGLK